MSLAVAKAEFFKQDYAKQFGWYVDEAGADVARRFQTALDQSLTKLARRPDLGRLRRFKDPRLRDLDHFTSSVRSTRFLSSIAQPATCCTPSA